MENTRFGCSRARRINRLQSVRSRFLGLVLCSALASSFTTGPSLAAVPTNDADAFRRLDLYLDRTAFQGTNDHVNITQYPGFLDSPQLIAVRGPADTVCLIRSTPYDGMNMSVTNTVPQSFTEYAINPPQYLTSVAVILMNFNTFNGSGAFNDAGKTVARVVVRYVDATTATSNVQVGLHTRDWAAGSVFCPGTVPFYTAQPSSPLMGVLWPAGAPNYFYDINEFQLPANKRNVKVDRVRVEAVIQDHFCSTFVPHIYSGVRLHGLSLWPRFTVLNAQAQPVVRQSQATGADHGGYLFGSTVVGTRRTTDTTACKVASLAMAYTYAGFNCSVDSLNAHLQRSQGYKPDQVAIVTFVSPSGDAIRYTATGQTKLKVGDRFLVEHGTYTNPLATYRVTVAGRNGQAIRFGLPHNATLPSVGDPGRVYWNTIPRRADRYTNNPQLRSVEVPATQLAAQVENLLVQNAAVQLNVGPSGGHWVVADGWTSSFRPGGSARGTYSILDPFNSRNYTKLIEGQYRNTFVAARYVTPILLGTLDNPNAVASGTPGLTIFASGARRIEVVDPLGRRMLRDASSGELVDEIPDAAIESLSSEHDGGGDVDDPITGFDVDIPTAIDGNYTVRTYVDDGLAMSATGYDDSGVFASASAVDTTIGPVGSLYNVQYSGTGGTVTVSYGGSVGVEIPRGIPGLLRVGRNPTSGPVAFVLAGSKVLEDAIEVFDVGGRRVDVIEFVASRGAQTVSWNWRSRNCGPGVYLARLRSQGTVVRFVVLQ